MGVNLIIPVDMYDKIPERRAIVWKASSVPIFLYLSISCSIAVLISVSSLCIDLRVSALTREKPVAESLRHPSSTVAT
jgi:hypothetical protein